MWMANAFRKLGGQYFKNMQRPMLLILAEHIMGAAFGRPSPNVAGGLRPPAPFGEFIIALLVLKALASAYFESIGHTFL